MYELTGRWYLLVQEKSMEWGEFHKSVLSDWPMDVQLMKFYAAYVISLKKFILSIKMIYIVLCLK